MARKPAVAGLALAGSLAVAVAAAVTSAPLRGGAATDAPTPFASNAASSGGLVGAAEELLSELSPAHNVYGSHPTEVVWADPAAGTAASNRSVCSSFISHLLERVYGLSTARLDALTGRRNPHAREYYEAIVAQRGFDRILTVDAVRPGDIIALSYPPGSGATGHVMLVDAPPKLREATAPLLAGTRQFAVVVIDSSHSVHGLADTRGTPAQHGTGVGRGTFRLYADSAGTIVASAWSILRGSRLDDVRVRKLAVGRVDLAAASAQPPLARSDDAGGSDDAPSRER
jgi:ABC-type amino acid transport substrate-binding protein